MGKHRLLDLDLLDEAATSFARLTAGGRRAARVVKLAADPPDDDADEELSFDTIRKLVRDALGNSDAGPPWIWITDLFASSVVYQVEQGGTIASKTFRRTYEIDPSTQAVGLGAAVEVRAHLEYEPVRMTVDFAADSAATDKAPPLPSGDPPEALPAGWVSRVGTFFRLGDYPDKGFAMNEAEADAAIAAFQPFPLEVEHVRTVFDGKLGHVARLWREGDLIKAEAQMPEFVDSCWGAEGRKISGVFNRATKAPMRGGIVLEPRVADAALMAAFAGARHNRRDRTGMQTIHDETVRQGATCATANYSKEELAMLSPEMAAWLKTLPPGTTRAAALAALNEAEGAAFSAPSASEAQMSARIHALEQQAYRGEARETINTFMHGQYITPAQFDGFVAVLTSELAADAHDAALGTPAEFSLGEGDKAIKVNRAGALKAAIQAGGRRVRTGEEIPAGFAFAADNPLTTEEDEERILKEAEDAARIWNEKRNTQDRANSGAR